MAIYMRILCGCFGCCQKVYTCQRKSLWALLICIKISNTGNVGFGFNEWLKAQNGKPMGQDWQTWSAALYLYAAKCVEEKRTPFFDEIRKCPEDMCE